MSRLTTNERAHIAKLKRRFEEGLRRPPPWLRINGEMVDVSRASRRLSAAFVRRWGLDARRPALQRALARVDVLAQHGRWVTVGTEFKRREQQRAATVAHVAGSIYARLAGRAPGRSENRKNGQPYGFVSFLEEVYTALGITASADNHAKSVARRYP